MLDYKKELQKAAQHFWRTRGKQKKHQGVAAGIKDTGNRSAVTGGKHADGFVKLIATIVQDAALQNVEINVTEKKPRTLPGFYRPCKEWDLVVLSDNNLVAVVEVKSQVGSFGNFAISLHARAAAFARAGKELKVLEAENHEQNN